MDNIKTAKTKFWPEPIDSKKKWHTHTRMVMDCTV